MILQQYRGLFEHLTAEGLGEMLTLRIDLWFEAVGLGYVSFAQGLYKEPVAVKQPIMFL